jgi:hypothetical protein
MTDDQIHWSSIINSLMIVLFLTGMVAMIMMRTLRRDISLATMAMGDDTLAVTVDTVMFVPADPRTVATRCRFVAGRRIRRRRVRHAIRCGGACEALCC